MEAISNIIENAIKYTDQNGKIKISVIPYQSFTAIEIKDNGIGIAEEEQASVFLRFFRSEKVNDKKGVGPVSYTHLDVYKRQEEAHIRTWLEKDGDEIKIDMHLRKNKTKGIALSLIHI